MNSQNPYDSHGDIVIRPQLATESHHVKPVESESVVPATAAVEPKRHTRVSLRKRIRNALRRQHREAKKQFGVSASEVGKQAEDIRTVTSRFVTELWNFMRQPVWVPIAKRRVREYSRGTLFLLDIVRFGGTFGLIFGVLFATLNYQSFLQISQSYIQDLIANPTLDTQTKTGTDSPANIFAQSLRQNDHKENDILSVLPTVGPPDDRIIIPALKLNVPITTPSTAALLRQDWTQVEQDIQSALRDGVVHYPGTARPGQAGNFFITGHSSYYPWDDGKFKTVFARLHELKPGDEYWVYWNGDKHRYIIREKYEVSPSEVKVLDQPGDRREATLMTCTPIGTTLRRLIVKADEVDPVTGKPLKVGERTDEPAVPQAKLEALPI